MGSCSCTSAVHGSHSRFRLGKDAQNSGKIVQGVKTIPVGWGSLVWGPSNDGIARHQRCWGIKQNNGVNEFCSILTSFNLGKTNNEKYQTFLFDWYIVFNLSLPTVHHCRVIFLHWPFVTDQCRINHNTNKTASSDSTADHFSSTNLSTVQFLLCVTLPKWRFRYNSWTLLSSCANSWTAGAICATWFS
jgi:hypothetical protein